MMLRSQVAGCGAYLPERVVSNDELAARLDTSDAWIRQRTGIGERRIAAPGELTSDLAFHAAGRALDAAGTVDVFVTDGFTGNVTLKAIEGVAKLFAESLRASFSHSMPARVGYVFARGSLKKLATRLDPRRYNGAMFLGLAGIAVKSHGSTDAFGFANAIGVAADVKRYGLLEKIIDEMERINAARADKDSGVVTASI
jgi:glycerol-3-phosphate acyltransferase PlsX